ncbi:SDR family NAD(P)-dependent oxidoreductase [Pontibacter actiniarum]|uniref:Short-chain dehydrogenase n=1 Tax=Pontibacter actiniarum TaxID=323450 RepID=A0A1X9YYT8_9BACT|nr:SDR family oxidoreductase [Pontibacter actiniarum]ARS37904.1 short-chain dehydrogenase [Pontibacter actiniarum]
MAEEQKQKYTALITGASGGIGLELAELFARDGHNLVLVARSEDKLNSLALRYAIKYKVYTKVVAQDLSKADGPEKVFAALKQEGVQVDVLVNNAGFGNFGAFRETDLQKELDMMQLNMVSLTHLCKLFLHQLRDGQHGRILNVSSTAAFPPGPYMAVYYASKAYVQSFTEALAAELEDENVSVTALCPGPTETEFQQAANLHESGLFSSQLVADARSVAKAGYSGMMAGEVVVIPGIQNKLTAFSTRLVPRSVLRQLVKKIQGKRA